MLFCVRFDHILGTLLNTSKICDSDKFNLVVSILFKISMYFISTKMIICLD